MIAPIKYINPVSCNQYIVALAGNNAKVYSNVRAFVARSLLTTGNIGSLA